MKHYGRPHIPPKPTPRMAISEVETLLREGLNVTEECKAVAEKNSFTVVSMRRAYSRHTGAEPLRRHGLSTLSKEQ